MNNQQQVRLAFMQSPLVIWVKTLLDESDNFSDYAELCNGHYLHKAWLQIDPHCPANPACCTGTPTVLQAESGLSAASVLGPGPTCETSSLSRIRNLSQLLCNIRAFYANALDQMLVLALPDVISIALSCEDEQTAISPDSPLYGLIGCTTTISASGASHGNHLATDHIRAFLLLLLGCAVQCERKEMFIERIKQLDIGTQHCIVECIREITDNPDSVFLLAEWTQPPDEPVDRERLYCSFVALISRLTKERDQLHQRVVDLSCELLALTTTTTSGSNNANIGTLTGILSASNTSLNVTSVASNAIIASNHCDHRKSSSSSSSHHAVELADVKSKLRRLQQELEEKSEAVIELREVIEQTKQSCNKLRHDNLELTQEARTAKAYRDEIDVLNERVRKIDRLEAEVQRYRDKMNELEYFKSRVEELREDNRILGETKTMLEEQLDSSRKRADKLPELEEKILKLNAYGNEINLQRELDRSQMERLIEEIAHLRAEKKSSNDELCRVQSELTDLHAQIRLDNETSASAVKTQGNLLEQISQDTSKRIIKLEHENQKLQNFLDDYRHNHVDIDSLMSLIGMPSSSPPFSALTSSSNGIEREAENGSIDSGFPCNSSSDKSKVDRLNELKDYFDKLKSSEQNTQQLTNAKAELEREMSELRGTLHDERNRAETIERNYTAACAENQKYQRIIETKSKKIQQFEADIASVESENQKLLANAESLKLRLRRLNDLEIEMTNLEADKHRVEQEKRSLDKEIGRLRASIECKDALIDEQAAKLSANGIECKRLRKELDAAAQHSARQKELEKECKDLSNSVTVQRNTLTTLQQDLISEKLRAQKYSEAFSKTIESVNSICDEHGVVCQLDAAASTQSPESMAGLVRARLASVIDRLLAPKQTQIEQLNVRLDEFASTNAQMNDMIDSLRRKLHIDDDDNENDNGSEQSSSSSSTASSLNELQRKTLELEDESRELRAQLHTAKEAITELAARSETAEAKLSATKERNAELLSDNAHLQVQNSALQSQTASLEAQSEALHEQIATIQDSIEAFRGKCEEYETTHRALIADNQSLQEIHQQLTADYDNLTQNHTALKQSYKSAKAANKELEEALRIAGTRHEQELEVVRAELQRCKKRAERERDSDEDTHAQTSAKLSSLNEEHKRVRDEHARLQNEHKMLQNIYKKLRAENNELKLRHTELQGEMAECRDRMNALNVEVSKLSNYCEMVALTNNTLEAQRKKLSTQSGSLLSQYNDLLLDLSGATGAVALSTPTSPSAASSASGSTHLLHRPASSPTIVDKLRDLGAKKDRLEKMFREYDISIEKNMPRVSCNQPPQQAKANRNEMPHKYHPQQQQQQAHSQHPLPDAIYGRLWEAQTPPLMNSTNCNTIISNPALHRQYSFNLSSSNAGNHHPHLEQTTANEKEKKFGSFEPGINVTPPRVPPRAQASQMNGSHALPRIPFNITHHHQLNNGNTHETVIEVTQMTPLATNHISGGGGGKLNSTLSNQTQSSPHPQQQQQHKMSINVCATRSSIIDSGCANISKVQISANSPLIGSSPSSGGAVVLNPSCTASVSNGSNANGYFTRGSFKSNSVNYGNLVRHRASEHSPAAAKLNGSSTTSSSSRHGGYHSPQLLFPQHHLHQHAPSYPHHHHHHVLAPTPARQQTHAENSTSIISNASKSNNSNHNNHNHNHNHNNNSQQRLFPQQPQQCNRSNGSPLSSGSLSPSGNGGGPAVGASGGVGQSNSLINESNEMNKDWSEAAGVGAINASSNGNDNAICPGGARAGGGGGGSRIIVTTNNGSSVMVDGSKCTTVFSTTATTSTVTTNGNNNEQQQPQQQQFNNNNLPANTATPTNSNNNNNNHHNNNAHQHNASNNNNNNNNTSNNNSNSNSNDTTGGAPNTANSIWYEYGCV